MKNVTLLELRENKKARIVDILAGKGLINRLMHLGLYHGKEIMKISHVGLRGPVVVKAGRTILALGHGVAAKILVSPDD